METEQFISFIFYSPPRTRLSQGCSSCVLCTKLHTCLPILSRDSENRTQDTYGVLLEMFDPYVLC